MKKVLSLVLVIAMVLSSMSFAFASPLTDIADNNYEDAINTLVGLGIVTGYEDGTFRPEKTVTRAEMAKLIVEILGYGDLVAGSKSNFTDTQGHWADAWIALAAGKGLVVGTGDGKFTPDRTVSYDEAITMVVRALGYTDECNELKGMTWPTKFKVKAAELGLTNDVKLASTGADRGGVAQLLFNALEATLVTVTTDGDVTLLQDQVGTNKVDRILLSRLAAPAPEYVVGTETLDKDSKYYGGNIVDLAPYMYQTVDAYVSKSDKYEVVYVKDVVSLVIEGTVTASSTSASITVEDANEKEHEITSTTGSTIKTYFNGVENYKAAADLEDAVVTVVIDDINGNDKFDAAKDKVEAVVATLATGERRINKEYVDGKLKIDSIALPEDDDEVDFDNLVIKGDATELEDIAKDSIVTLYAGKESVGTLVKLTMIVSNDTIEGKITKTNADKSEVTVDGTTYDMSAFADYTDVKAGAEGVFLLNAEGEISAFDKEGSGAPENYAVVIAALDGTYDAGFGVTKEAQIKLATKDGKVITYKVDEDATIVGGLVNGVNLDAASLKDKVVEYDLTSDGKIDTVAFPTGLFTNRPFVPESKSFILADNVVIFDAVTLEEDGTKEYGVLTVEQLDEDSITADVVYNDDGEIELLFVTNGVELEKTGTYGIITNVELTTNDDDEDVYVLTAWVDGVKSSYLTTKSFRTNNVTPSSIKSAGVVKELKFTDGVVSAVTAATTDLGGSVADVNTSKSLIMIGSKWYALADDAVIYLQTKSNTMEVADIYEIEDTDTVQIYNSDTTNDDIEIVVIKLR